MNIDFKTLELLNFYIGNYKGKQAFSEIILKAYRKQLNLVSQIDNLEELSKIRSLNIEKLKNFSSIRVNIQYRIEFDYDKQTKIFTVLNLSKHYE